MTGRPGTAAFAVGLIALVLHTAVLLPLLARLSRRAIGRIGVGAIVAKAVWRPSAEAATARRGVRRFRTNAR